MIKTDKKRKVQCSKFNAQENSNAQCSFSWGQASHFWSLASERVPSLSFVFYSFKRRK